MASIEFLTKRIEGKQAEIQKLTAKKARIEKAAATNWEVNPYYYNESDLKYVNRDIENATKALEDYQNKLAKEQEKANSRNVAVIIEFLENWKQKMREFYNDEFAKYPEAYAEHKAYMKQLEAGYSWNMPRDEYKKLREQEKRAEALHANRWGHLFPYINRKYNRESDSYTFTFRTEEFEKEIKREAERKYDDIIERTNYIVGKITDATGLEIGYKGDLNGIVIGTEGKAKVNTIGAGGYNIQCFHFRTLIHEVQ